MRVQWASCNNDSILVEQAGLITYRRVMIVVGLVMLDHGGKRLSWNQGCKVQWYIYRILALPYMAVI